MTFLFKICFLPSVHSSFEIEKKDSQTKKEIGSRKAVIILVLGVFKTSFPEHRHR